MASAILQHDHVRLSHAHTHVIYTLSSCRTLQKMDLVETDLFGGAIKANFPKGFIDASYVMTINHSLAPFQPTLT
jgi:hypothetical protein